LICLAFSKLDILPALKSPQKQLVRTVPVTNIKKTYFFLKKSGKRLLKNFQKALNKSASPFSNAMVAAQVYLVIISGAF
jgi:hypothetical protein